MIAKEIGYDLGDDFSSISYKILLPDDLPKDAAQTAPFLAATISIEPIVKLARKRAVELGLAVDDDVDDPTLIANARAQLIQFMISQEPLSEDWYLVKISAFDAQLKTLRADRLKVTMEGIIVHTAVQLGAFCREYELSIANKQLTRSRRKQIRSFMQDADGQRAAANAERVRQAELWQAEARKIAQELSDRRSSLKGGAKTNWIRKELGLRGFPSRSLGSIRRALAKKVITTVRS